MARVIPKTVLEDIRFRSDIADVIGGYLNLQRSGSTFKALCPFHKEKTPSFHVNPQRQIFHCFGCGAGGDVFRFLMQHEGVDFMAAVKMLAERAGVPLQMEDDDAPGVDKAALYRIHEEVAFFFQRCLLEAPVGAHAREYLVRRQLKEETVRAFLIGYAPDRWDAMAEWARRKGVALEQMETAGLVVRSTKSDARRDLYDRFRDRLMFPIRDEQGRVIAYSGRCFVDKPDTAKYVNSPETPLFRKGRVLYALDKARRPIVEARHAIICEGQIDCIRCHEAGFPNAVASQGTAFSEEHARALHRYADSATLVFDSDRAGQDAAVRTASLFMAAGLAVRVAALPRGEDPDSFILKRGPEAFRTLLDAATSAVRFQVSVLSGRDDVGKEEGLVRVSREVVRTILQAPNPVQRDALLTEAIAALNVKPTVLHDQMRQLARQDARRESVRDAAQPPAPPSAQARRPAEELALCEYLIHLATDAELGPLIEQHLPLALISDPLCQAFAGAALSAWREGRDIQEALAAQPDATGDLQRFAAAVLMAPPKSGGAEFSRGDAVRDLILGLWRRRVEAERVALGDRDPQARTQLTLDLKSLRHWKSGAAVIELRMAS